MHLVHDTTPEDSNVISLSEAKKRYQPGGCAHRHLIVDTDEAEVTCGTCGVKLDAVAMLSRFASEESRWARQREGMIEERRKLEKRQRCKYQHCGQMTRIR